MLAIVKALGGTNITSALEPTPAVEPPEWEYSLWTAYYLAQHGRDYMNPSVTADHGWLHLEARYNYEALKTGSFWIGYNFMTGKKLTIEAMPMLGGVFGDITGIAPGYTITLAYGPVELYTQGEYFFDAGTRDNNYFYTWSELSCKPSRWFRVGLVVDRSKASGDAFDIRRGPLVGFDYKKVDFTTYWLSPGQKASTIIFAVTINFP
ncbi:MAG: hypothetical protein ACJ8M1_03375 [Chthoniobacterales bacterium]